MVTQGVVEVAGQGVAYRRSSGHGQAVVLVHGNSSSSRTWRHLLEGPFGRRYRCVALDLPGHGASSPAAGEYSLPGYAAVLAGFVDAVDARDAVVVGWSLGGHIALEAEPLLPDAAGFVLFGAPPVGDPSTVARAFLPHPALGVGFTAEVGEREALLYASACLAPGTAVPTESLVRDILATDGAARAGVGEGLSAGRFADEVQIVSALKRPLAVLHGGRDQLVSLEYLRQLAAPSLWRGSVQVVEEAGHALQEEAPQALAAVVEEFIADLP